MLINCCFIIFFIFIPVTFSVCEIPFSWRYTNYNGNNNWPLRWFTGYTEQNDQILEFRFNTFIWKNLNYTCLDMINRIEGGTTIYYLFYEEKTSGFPSGCMKIIKADDLHLFVIFFKNG